MSDFENALLNGLPLAEAAAFHVQLLGYDRPKVATAGGMAPPALPPTANGQQMPAPAPVTLPGTAMGQNTIKQAASDKSPEEVGKERARASLSAEKEKAEAHKREHGGGLVGSITGAALGGYASHRYGKGNPMATIAGAAVGHHIAGKTGREVGAVMDRHAKTASVIQGAVKTVLTPLLHAAVRPGAATAIGAGLGAVGGAVAGGEGHRISGALGGAAVGGAAGAGASFGGHKLLQYGASKALAHPEAAKLMAQVPGARQGFEAVKAAPWGGMHSALVNQVKLGAAMKRAFEEIQNAGMGMGPSSPVDPQQAAQALDQPPAKPTPVTPAVDQATQQYLATQQELNQATDASAVQFYQEQLAAAKEQLEAAQQEAQQLQQSQAMHEQELAQIQTQVADSTQKAMMASDQVLKEQQGAAAMRMAYQQLRGQILNTVSSDPPSMSPDQAAMSAASTGAAPAAPGAAETGAPAPTAGPAGQAPSPGTPPGSPAPEGDATVPNADGIAASKPMMDGAQPATAVGQKDQQKVGSAKETAASKMTKAVGAAWKKHGPVVKKHGPGAAAGAALGAATGHHETKRESGDDYAKKNPGKFTAMSAAAGGVAGGVLGPKMKDNIVKVREHVRSIRAAQAAAKKKK